MSSTLKQRWEKSSLFEFSFVRVLVRFVKKKSSSSVSSDRFRFGSIPTSNSTTQLKVRGAIFHSPELCMQKWIT